MSQRWAIYIHCGFTPPLFPVSNVAVRLSSRKDGHRRHAILVNAHWDSALSSYAAADDTANIAVMLELVSLDSFLGKILTD